MISLSVDRRTVKPPSPEWFSGRVHIQDGDGVVDVEGSRGRFVPGVVDG